MRLARLISSFGAGGHFRLVCRSYGANEFVPLTSDRKPHLRRLDFAQLSDGDLKVFEGILGNKRVLTDADDLEGYNTDWMRAYRGNGAVVLRPKTVNEVSEVVRYCNERRLAVVPQGGNTGLVGGSVPVFDEVIISLGLMNNILDINPITGLALCESGVVLEQLDGKLRDHDLVAPLDLGAKGTCQIGGNISTNAGGLRLLRYGSLRNTVLGLEAVLPNGEVMDCLNSLRKDNTGYDLKQLFIGAEGTLGIVTKVALLCPPAPKAVNVAFLGLESYEKVLETFKKTKSYLSEILSACELVDSNSLEAVERKLGYRSPLSTSYPFYLLLETSGSSEAHDMEKLNDFLEFAMSEGLIQDGTIAQDSSQVQNIWTIRESIAMALSAYNLFLCFDVSLKLSDYYQIVEELTAFCQSDHRLEHLTVTGFGHLGDGNIHLNFVTDTYTPEVAALLEPFIFEWVSRHRGSISAEHGLGLSKNSYLHLNKPSTAITLMRALKATFDPNGIMNPYKYLPPVN